MRSCLNCDNREICRALWGVVDTQYEASKPGGFLKKDRFLFDNLTEIYQALAKTCKRYQKDEEVVEK